MGGTVSFAVTEQMWDVSMAGACMAYSQYFGDYDHSYNKDYFDLVQYEQFQSGGESAMIALVEDPTVDYKVGGASPGAYVVVSFRGMEDLEPTYAFTSGLEFSSMESTMKARLAARAACFSPNQKAISQYDAHTVQGDEDPVHSFHAKYKRQN